MTGSSGAALRWHGRLELEARDLTFERSQLALSALDALHRDLDDSEARRLLTEFAKRIALRPR